MNGGPALLSIVALLDWVAPPLIAGAIGVAAWLAASLTARSPRHAPLPCPANDNEPPARLPISQLIAAASLPGAAATSR